jgi:uncharacterized delta-60 repeat protein/gliding motility-associated-like protein
MKKRLLWILFTTVSATTFSSAQPGTLDESFNGKGVKEFSFIQNTSEDTVAASLLQPDGKLLLAVTGTNNKVNPAYQQGMVLRLLPDGSLDKTFGIEGKVDFQTILKDFFPQALALSPSGKIILAGHSIDVLNNNQYVPTLVSLTANGSKDDLFGETLLGNSKKGYRKLTNTTFNGYSFRTVQVHPLTGKIYASGSRTNRTIGSAFFLVTAWDALGNTDLSFNKNTNTPGVNAFAVYAAGSNWATTSLLQVKDNTLFVGGSSRSSGPFGLQTFSIAAVNILDGTLRTSFFTTGTKGLTTTSVQGQVDECTTMRFTPDSSNMVLAGYTQSNATALPQLMLYKVNKKGVINQDFSPLGYKLIGLPNATATGGKASSLEVLPNGELLLGGSFKDKSTGSDFWGMVHTKADGTLYTAGGVWNTTGVYLYNGSSSAADALNSKNGIMGIHYLASSSQILLVGSAKVSTTTGTSDALVKRIYTDGSNDKTYANSSIATHWVLNENSSIEDLAVRTDGKIWVCGNTKAGPAAALLNADGSLSSVGIIQLGGLFNALPSASPYVTAIEMYGDKVLMAGNYSTNAFTQDLFLLLLNSDGTVDTSFGSAGLGTAGLIFTTGVHVHDLLVQPGKGFLLHGYINSKPTMVRFDLNGKRDPSFSGTGTYIASNTVTGNYKTQKIEAKLQPDGKIVGVAVSASTNYQFIVFRLNDDGSTDAGFAMSGSVTLDVPGSLAHDYPTCLFIRADKKILIGGYTQQSTTALTSNYLFLQLTEKGAIDASFGTNGGLMIDKGFGFQAIGSVFMENTSTFTAMGIIGGTNTTSLVTVLRYSGDGKQADNTFNNKGHAVLGRGFPQNALLYKGSLYLAGLNKRPASEANYYGQVVKIKLGGGTTSIKTTNLVTANYNKTFGDAPFKVESLSNSPAPTYYSLAASTCAEVNPLTGLVKITCATVDKTEDILIRLLQLPTSGYTGDTAYATIKVVKGQPRVVFTNQGGKVNDTIVISAFASSASIPVFTQLDGAVFVQFLSNDTVTLAGIGSSTVSAYFPATENYEGATATALVSCYIDQTPPDANTDYAELVFGSAVNVSIDIIGNDEAYTGVIVPQYIDLDPSTSKADSFFVSPALGLFQVDTTGVVTYTPFSGFIGSGAITYTIRDSKGLLSAPGIIQVAVVSPPNVPALKATQLVTPNADGLNEAFVIGFVNLEKENKLKIFDRNGQELFSKENYKNDWSGELPNGSAAENGTYYYLFTEGSASDQRELKGAVEIRR